MSSSEIDLRALASPGVQITISDHAFKPLATGFGSLELAVEPGLYTVRFLAGTAVRREVVAVTPDGAPVVVESGPLQFRSATPLTETLGASYIHRDAAERMSRTAHRDLGEGGGLLVFVRDEDTRGSRHPLAGVSLHDHRGTLLCRLQNAGEHGGDGPGEVAWAGVSLKLSPGRYRLRSRNDDIGTLEQMLIVSRGWQSQRFLIRRSFGRAQHGRTADLGGGSMMLARLGEGFDASRPDLRLTELARQALATGRLTVATQQLHEMVDAKWQNPMLGIYGAHLLLLEEEVDEALLEHVRGTLKMLVGDHPDVLALDLWARDGATPTFDTPPMLLSSWRILIEASAELPHAVPPGSLAARIAHRVLDSSTWLLWRAPRTAHRGKARPPASASVPLRVQLTALGHGLSDVSDDVARGADLGPVEQDVLAFAVKSAEMDTQAAAGDIPLDAEDILSERRVVNALGVPKGVAEDAVSALAKRFSIDV